MNAALSILASVAAIAISAGSVGQQGTFGDPRSIRIDAADARGAALAGLAWTRVGDLDLAIVRVERCYPLFIDLAWWKLQSRSPKKLLAVTVAVRNTSDQPMPFVRSGPDGRHLDAVLNDRDGNVWSSLKIPDGVYPEGRHASHTIDPGAVAYDVLLFDALDANDGVGALDLSLPLDRYGVTGFARVSNALAGDRRDVDERLRAPRVTPSAPPSPREPAPELPAESTRHELGNVAVLPSARVAVLSARVEPVEIEREGGARVALPTPRLVVRVRVEPLRDLDYAPLRLVASAQTESRSALRPRAEGLGGVIVGAHPGGPVRAGAAFDDLLVFETPAVEDEDVLIVLPGDALGSPGGPVVFRVESDAIARE